MRTPLSSSFSLVHSTPEAVQGLTFDHCHPFLFQFALTLPTYP
ncbi:MAG: hypothetical protein ABIJ50_01365 [Pseudomonadota bacterium]